MLHPIYKDKGLYAISNEAIRNIDSIFVSSGVKLPSFFSLKIEKIFRVYDTIVRLKDRLEIESIGYIYECQMKLAI